MSSALCIAMNPSSIALSPARTASLIFPFDISEILFKNYYGKIIEDAKLSKDDLLLLFFVALAGPVKAGENKLYSILMDEYGKEIREDEIIEKLYSLELIDWF